MPIFDLKTVPFAIVNITADIRKSLESVADEKTRLSAARYFKESITVHGVRSADVKKIEMEFYLSVKNRGKEEIFDLCTKLWQSPFFEENIIACNWSEKQSRLFEREDMKLFESWLSNYVTNWATCDTLCNHTIGNMVMKYPDTISFLKRWTISENRWMRRGAAVSLIVPARKGLFVEEILQIAMAMLTDPDDMVQKGYGWMLKAASQKHQSEIFSFVMDNRYVMPRTALRYAIEKMPPELKAAAMKRV